ncbi:hypothetical protein Tsubulata_003174, partial [Turnera subulata]
MESQYRFSCQGLRLVGIRRVLTVVGVVIIVFTLFQCVVVPYGKRWSDSSGDWPTVLGFIENATVSNYSISSGMHAFDVVENDTRSSYSEGIDRDEDVMEVSKAESNSPSEKSKNDALTSKMGFSFGTENGDITDDDPSRQAEAIDKGHGHLQQSEKVENTGLATDLSLEAPGNTTGIVPVLFQGLPPTSGENAGAESRNSVSLLPTNVTPADPIIRTIGTLPRNINLSSLNKSSITSGTLRNRGKEMQPISISQMDLLLHQSRPRRISARDRELLSARMMIQNAPIVANSSGLHTPAFRNISEFIRSYELMERILKVFIYKEGEKPVFHQAKMRGIYASEGWFMKLMEGNKKFVVRDPRKAHLFYLPFSSQMLRISLFEQNSRGQKYLEEYLKQYVDLIAQKYGFWNRTGGADHFLVACHDWASRMTRRYMRNCIRVLCNANAAKDFIIGKDTALPATYIRSAENPLKDIGGKPPSERSFLAFFAGGIHGYVRPVLLQYWENKEPDMKIFGPMPRDIESKQRYREHMKSSKYCICVRGYEVYSPRVVEAIFYECVPVIISDNYVPPFFEVLNWEAFSVFVQEKDIPNLRNILLSIPEEKYLAMQFAVKMVQKHFLWHKKPVKYDLFHMILHSVWRNRVFQL